MTSTWKTPTLLALLVAPTAMLAPTPLRAQSIQGPSSQAEDDYAGESADRYAQVKVLEGDVRIRKAGEAEEALTRGIPVTEGDVVESRGRGVLQLGDGSRIAFGASTRFTVAALFTGREGGRQVLLRMDYGRMRISLANAGDARFRIDTPTGTASLSDRASATVEVDRDRVTRFKLHAGRGSYSNERDQAKLTAGERLTIYSGQDSLDRVRSFNTYEMDSFDQWCDDILVRRRSQSADYVPREIRPYADDLDDNGEWVDVDEVGRVWRPRVSVEWRPYWRGRWGAYSGGMTWISDDPWGYVTSHHGRWGWTSHWGWYWIPGVFYSPAWVAWNWNSGYCGWSPLNYWNSPSHWGYGAWNGGYCWNVVSVNHINQVNIHNRVVVDRNVFSGFNGGTGTTTWTAGAGRGVTPPWRTNPVIASSAEFRNPSQFSRALDRQIQNDRLTAYGRQLQNSGHVLQTRTHVSRPVGGSEGATTMGGSGRPVRPFEDRGLRTPGPRVRDMVDRPNPSDNRPSDTRGGTETRDGGPRRIEYRDRPAGGSGETSTTLERRPDRNTGDRGSGAASRERIDRPQGGSTREDAPRDRTVETPRERRFEERRPDPPRERPREERQEWRQEHVERPREERREQPREERREQPREERRIERQESRPSPPPPRMERPSSPPPRMEAPSSPPPRMERPSAPPPARSESRETRRN